MSEVASFMERKRNRVWTCACGFQLFFMLTTREMECGSCGLISNGRWNTDEKPEALKLPYENI